ncbi:hypothetical protein L1049_024565 [Liquidambar formosana]|uniref:Cytochrome P450 n=1 Tax=Liquidambar formosana TaxID=63359 RepID=A0AAP0RW99_LIQFO
MAMAGGFWFVVLVGVVLGVILNHFWPLFLKHRGVLPKGNFGWPLLGETLGFLKPHPSNSIGEFLQDHCSRYGKVFKSHLFFSPTVVSCDQELNYFILQNEDKLFECSYPKPIHGILGKISMLVAVGDTHKRLRNVALSLVTTTKSKPHFLNDIETTAIHILDSWKHKRRVIFCEEARKAGTLIFTFDVIVKQVLGLTPDEPQTTKILEDFLTFMRGLISFPLYIPGTPYARAVQEHQYIRSIKPKDEYLNWEDYKKMDFTQNVINEALRYGNVVKFVHRKALKDVKFRDYLIPSGWKVLPIFSAVHLDPSLHASALQFHPWRWEKQDQTCKKFTPFGGGTRCCPGSELAKVEVAFFLHHLVQNFRWTTEDVDQPVAYPYVEFRGGLALIVDQCSI